MAHSEAPEAQRHGNATPRWSAGLTGSLRGIFRGEEALTTTAEICTKEECSLCFLPSNRLTSWFYSKQSPYHLVSM